MKTKSALSYFGSDSEIAGRLAAMLEHCSHVTIPFVGGAAILPHLRARAIVANDRHKDAVVFYRVLSGVYGPTQKIRLIRECRRTLSHPVELEQALEILRDITDGIPPYGRAWAFWAACWLGRKGKGGTKYQGGMPSVRRTANGGTNASRIRVAGEDLEEWAEHFRRCEWESVCFRELLPKVADRSGCGLYCDPPWVKAGKDYLHPFDERDHRDLAELLERFESTAVVVRYGDDPLVRELYPPDRWQIHETQSRTQAGTNCGEVWFTRNTTEADA